MEKHACLCSVGRWKIEVWKPNCKSVYQLNLQKKAFVLCNWIWGNELLLPSFINDRNNAVTKWSFMPNFQACRVIFLIGILPLMRYYLWWVLPLVRILAILDHIGRVRAQKPPRKSYFVDAELACKLWKFF